MILDGWHPDTGKKWVYAPKVIPGWTDYGEKAPGSQPKPVLPKPPGSLKGFVTPDYSNREDFSQFVIKELKVDPFTIDPVAEMKKADARLPAIFNDVFKG